MKIFGICAVIFLLIVPSLAVAQPDIGLGQNGLANQIAEKSNFNPGSVTDTTLSESIGKIIRVVLSMVGVLFLALTVYAGVLWMTASGNEEKVESSQKILRAAVTGLVILLAAYGITALVLAGIGFAAQPASTLNAQDANNEQGFWSQYGGYVKNSAMRMIFLDGG